MLKGGWPVWHDVSSGNLDARFRRLAILKMDVQHKAAGPTVIDGTSYELELKISYIEAGNQHAIGPFVATTERNSRIPADNYDIEIADFPHNLGSG